MGTGDCNEQEYNVSNQEKKTSYYATVFTTGNLVKLVERLQDDGAYDVTIDIRDKRVEINYRYE